MRAMRSVSVLLFVAALGLAGCAHRERSAPTDFHITLERGPCFGTCPVYRVMVASDGTVTYDGRRFVAVTGRQTRRIAPAKARALYDAFIDAKFFALADSYRAHATDLPTKTLTLNTHARAKTVVDYGGRMVGMPKSVSDLEALVDETASTQDWIKPRRAD